MSLIPLENGSIDDVASHVAIGSFQQGMMDNIPTIASPVNLGSAVSSALSPLSLLTGSDNKPTLSVNKTDPGVAGDNGRLQIIRSRAARTLYQNNGKNSYTSDRGPITSMKLLPGPGYDPVSAVKGASSDVTEAVNSLVAGKFANFFLTDFNLAMNEKVQITQTFGDNEVIYYFGRQPLQMNISGLLFDSLENDWFSRFLTLYAGVLRGTELAKSFSMVEITFPNMVVRGTIAGISINQNSQRDTDIPFSMQFIAKTVVPLPAVLPAGSGTSAHNNVGTLLDFKANRSGVAGYTLGSGGLGGGFMDSVSGVTKTFGNVTSGVSGALGSLGSLGGSGSLLGGLASGASGVGDTLNSFRTNIFTPVFGVISSITKIVKDVTGTIKSIVSSFTDPVNRILGDIQNISAQVSGIALTIENTINSIIAVPARTANNLKNTIRSLKSTAGTITRMPENISETFKRLYGSGHLQGKAVLSSGKSGTKSKAAILTSGAPYKISGSNRL